MAEPAGQKRAPARPVRPRELEDALNLYLYHPLAWRLARLLAPTPLTPNAVSVIGACVVVSAGLAYTVMAPPASAWLGMALHMLWHVVDGADGDLARLTGRASPRGEMVDGLCDYASHGLLYLMLAADLARDIGALAWPVALAAGVAHALQANHVEAQRRFYLHWVYGKPWLHNRREGTGGPLGILVELYLNVAGALNRPALTVDRLVTAVADDPRRLERVRSVVRAESGALLRIQKLLGPNQRAIVLGLVMLATGSPLLYFAFGGLWLSLVLVGSVALHNRAAQRILARIS